MGLGRLYSSKKYIFILHTGQYYYYLESAIKVIFPYNYLVGHPLIKTSTVLTTTTNK